MVSVCGCTTRRLAGKDRGGGRKPEIGAAASTGAAYTTFLPPRAWTGAGAGAAAATSVRGGVCSTTGAGMAACFKRAVDKGLAIHVAPHLDDGLGLGGWRNGLVFDPLARYGALSYAEFMLYPIADALNAAIGPDTRVSVALQVCM